MSSFVEKQRKRSVSEGTSANLWAAILAYWLSTMPGTTQVEVWVAFVVLAAIHEVVDAVRWKLVERG